VIVGFIFTVVMLRIGRRAGVSKVREKDRGAVDEADGIRRAVNRIDDPVARLREHWKRPILPDSPADSNQ